MGVLMGMIVKYDGLEVCTDCAMLIANGEGTDEHDARMLAKWGDDLKHMVLAGEENEEASFSWRPCDGCGSHLGGDRVKAAVLGEDLGRKYSTRYVHQIVPSSRDTGPSVVLTDADLEDHTTLGAALRTAKVLHKGARVAHFRIETDGHIVAFPRMPGMTTYWHSVILTPIDTCVLHSDCIEHPDTLGRECAQKRQ